MSDSTKKILINLFKVGVVTSLLYWLVANDYLSYNKIKQYLTPETFAVCFLLSFTNIFLTAYRWKTVLHQFQIEMDIKSCFRLQLIGNFFSFFIPGGVGGDLAKGYYFLKKLKGKKLIGATSILFDRVLGLYSLIILSLTTILFTLEIVFQSKALKTLSLFVALAFIGLSVFFVLVCNSRIRNYILSQLKKLTGNELALSFNDYQFTILKFAHSFLASFVLQLVMIGLFYYIGMTAEPDVPVAAYLFAIPLGIITTALPLAPAGVGVGQVAMLFLFQLYVGKTVSVGQIGITVFQFCYAIISLVGAKFYLQQKSLFVKESQA